MCTVTYISQAGKIIITHSRDEKSRRPRAIPPREYNVNGYTLLFPRDGSVGGTWIALNKNGGAAVLLNGAFKQHHHRPPYRKSRGLAFLDILAAPDLYLSYCNVDLAGIEPFTIILSGGGMLYECRWNGNEKHISKLQPSEAHIWSSVTLYDENVMTKRTAWFRRWLHYHPQATTDEIIQFHLSAGDGDINNDLLMNRDGHTLTVSITSMELDKSTSVMQYLDLQDHTRYTHELTFTKAAVIQ